jgi:hypothetical protein
VPHERFDTFLFNYLIVSMLHDFARCLSFLIALKDANIRGPDLTVQIIQSAHAQVGSTRRFGVVRATSASPESDQLRTSRHVSNCHKQTHASAMPALFDYLIGQRRPLIAHSATCEPTRKQAKDLMRGVERIC